MPVRRSGFAISAGALLIVVGCGGETPDVTSGSGVTASEELDADGGPDAGTDEPSIDSSARALEDGTYVGEVVVAPHIPNVASLDDARVTMVISGDVATLERVIEWVLDRPQGCTDTERYSFMGEATWTGDEAVLLFDGTHTFEHLATTCDDHDILPSTSEDGVLDSVTVSHDSPAYNFLEGETGMGRFQLEYVGA